MNSVNDIALRAYCPEASQLDDRYALFKNILPSLNMDLESSVDDLGLFFAIMTYRSIETFLEEVNMKSIERMYTERVWKYLEATDENIKISAVNWVRFIQITNMITEYMNDSDHITTNVMFNKTISGIRYQLKLDLLLLSKQKHTLITFAPHLSMYPGMSIMSNINTALSLEYLYEAELFPDEVIEICYSIDHINKIIFDKKINTKEYRVKQVNNFNKQMVNNDINMLQCRVCPARRKCFPMLKQ